MTTIRWREISFFISKYTRAISLCFFARNFYFFFSNAIVFDAKLFEKNNNNHNTSLFIPNNAHLHISVVCRDRLLPFKLLISDVLQKFEIFWIFVSRCVSQTNSNAHIEWYMLWLSFLFFFPSIAPVQFRAWIYTCLRPVSFMLSTTFVSHRDYFFSLQ